MGIKPVEMMDRKFKHKLPDFEVITAFSVTVLYCTFFSFKVGFIQGIAEPCCQLLTTVMPHLNSLLQTTRYMFLETQKSGSSCYVLTGQTRKCGKMLLITRLNHQ